jgi:hypothetical protein
MDLGRRLFRGEGARLIATDLQPHYRKLPGHRRGFISTASLWTATDHLLSVKSSRFREEYKRFYFRDIQAIVITEVPRFPVSTRAAVLGTVLAIAMVFARTRSPALIIALWLVAAGLAAAWIYISAARSCVCRLYTAVSREDLPSLYRIRTARKVLLDLESRIVQAQGAFAVGRVAAAEHCSLGPLNPSGDSIAIRSTGGRRSRTLASDLFLASLLADAVATGFKIGASSPLLATLSAGLTICELSGAIWMLMQHYRGILSTSLQRLAIVSLVFIGGILYVQAFTESVQAALAGRRGLIAQDTFARSAAIRPVYVAGVTMLGLAGLVLSFKASGHVPPSDSDR